MSAESDLEIEPEVDASRGQLGRGARAFGEWALVVAVALFVAIGGRTFFLAHFVVEGSSV